jgi:hypothetical protein
MLTVYILASRKESRSVEALWKHLTLLRRQARSVTWANPLYVEDLVTANALVPAIPEPYIVIGCLSSQFISELLDQPAIREMVAGALRSVPFLISACQWNQAPCPFAGKTPAAPEILTETRQRDRVLVEAVGRIGVLLASIRQEM